MNQNSRLMRNTLCLLALAAMATSLAHGASLGTGIGYQGRLTDNGGPANGTYSFRFRLLGDETGSTQIGSTVDVANQAIADGLINTTLDFGATAFNGDACWLEVSVKPGGAGGAADYIKLSPPPLPPGGSSQFSRVAGDVLNGVITGSKLAPLSINATHINDGAVSGSKLAPGSVTGGNVADSALTA